MKRLFLFAIVLISVFGSYGFSQDEGFDTQDELNTRFGSTAPTNVEYNGYFEAIKFWRVNAGETPDFRTPTKIYARAWYSPSGNPRSLSPMFRTSFNGTPLKPYTMIGGTSIYAMKRDSDPMEEWLSWYAHLDETHFPKSFAFDTILEAYRDQFAISFPLPFKLNVPRAVRMGGSDLTVEARAVAGGAPKPMHGEIRFYPTTTLTSSVPFISGSHLTNPDIINMNFPSGEWITGSPGFGVGVHEGLVGIGTCNDVVVRFLEKKILFRACSVTVQPVNITVARPS